MPPVIPPWCHAPEHQFEPVAGPATRTPRRALSAAARAVGLGRAATASPLSPRGA